MKKVYLPDYIRKEVFERAMAEGHCECDHDNHDHDADPCNRKPKHFIHKKLRSIGDPDGWLMICSRCRELIRLEKG
jgi:hypothetical protein